MRPRVLKVDDDGLHLERGFVGPLDVHFDGWRGWSVSVERPEQELVRWPKRLAEKLDGSSLVKVTAEEVEVFSAEVAFGEGEGRVQLVDRLGNPIIIDKWGLAQRPFDGRREGGAVEAMTTMAERVLDVMRDSCGLDGWISFGTLLGAARSGQVIGHDSDIDLCYLSEKTTPAEMATELWAVARALQDAGINVKHKTASFLTVVYPAPDGGQDGIDIYTCFYVGDLLHETATVRQQVPREAIVPLRSMEFEGRQMPAPADPSTMLTVSYGPGWKVPDPSFRHLPSTEITDRFDAWFGLLMPQRREWTAYNGRVASQHPEPSDFSGWVTDHLGTHPDGAGRTDGRDVHVLDVGSGSSVDLRRYAAAGHRATGYDYAHPGKLATGELTWPEGVSRRRLNLFSMRDCLSLAAVVSRFDHTLVVTARETLEALHPQARAGFWQFAAATLGAGGRAYLEGVSRGPGACHAWQTENEAGRIWPVDPLDVADAARVAGATVIHREGFPAARRALQGRGAPARWRIILEWPVRKEIEA